MAQITAFPWAMLAAMFSGVALLGFVWVNFVRPWWRLRELKRPCNVAFHIRPTFHGDLGYVRQDDLGHDVKELVLPSNSTVEVEINCYPKLAININEMRFGCEGDNNEKPMAEKRVTRYVDRGKREWTPETDSDYTGRGGAYHWTPRYSGRSAPSCMAVGFVVKTKRPGKYNASVSFFMDELEGTANDLVIVVEDQPITPMRCHTKGHWEWKCQVLPK